MNIKNSVKILIQNAIDNYRYKKRAKNYIRYYNKIVSKNPELIKPADGEKEWLDHWRKYDKNLSPLSYRIFSRFVGEDINIMPMELCINIVEPVLNPNSYRGFYRNKNSLNLIGPEKMTAKTIIRKIAGFFYDSHYEPIIITDTNLKCMFENYDKVLFKPALEDSGRGITLFRKKGDVFINDNGDELNVDYFNNLKSDDFQIQACIEQSAFTADFNPSCVNSFRIMTYRSVKTGEIHVPNLFFKIGGKNQVVDNAHGGGVMCGVDNNGRLLHYTYNYLGETFINCFDKDMMRETYIVPNYEGLIAFAKEVAKNIVHHHLLSLDVALDKNNNPVLIEVNSEAFAGWAYQMSTGSIFKEYTDEVMEYCFHKI